MTFYKKQPILKNELKIIVRFYRNPTLLNGRMTLTAESETTQVIFFLMFHLISRHARWCTDFSSMRCLTSGLDYKTITIFIMTIISDTTIWSITYHHNWQCQLRLKHRLRLRWSTFIVQASFTIVAYDHQNIFIIQATAFGNTLKIRSW